MYLQDNCNPEGDFDDIIMLLVLCLAKFRFLVSGFNPVKINDIGKKFIN